MLLEVSHAATSVYLPRLTGEINVPSIRGVTRLALQASHIPVGVHAVALKSMTQSFSPLSCHMLPKPQSPFKGTLLFGIVLWLVL